MTRLAKKSSEAVNPDSQVSSVNAACQVAPDHVDKAVEAEIPSDPLSHDIEDCDISHTTSDEDMEGSSSESDLTRQSSESQPLKKRKLLKHQPDTSAFSGRVCSYTIVNSGIVADPRQFLNENIDEIVEILEEELNEKKCIRVVLLFECEMKKAVENDDSILSIYKSGPTSIYRNSNIPFLLLNMLHEILREFTEKLPKGSGWTLARICELVVRVARFSPLSGGTFIETPASIESKKCVVNVENRDNRCFEYSILTPLSKSHHRYRVSGYQHLQHDVSFKDLPMPMPVEYISKFEELNPTYSVNVYEIDSEEAIHPIRVAEAEKENHRDLLLLHSEDRSKFHYCCITNFSRFVAGQDNRMRIKVHVCKKCLTKFHRNGKERLEAHKPLCNANIHTVTKLSMQKNDQTQCKFRSYTKSYRVPFVVYAHILSCHVDPETNHEKTPKNDIGKPVPLSVACYVHTHLGKEHCGDVALGYKLFHGEDCVKQFVSHVENVTENISKIYKSPKNMDEKSPEKEAELSKQTVCHTCDKEFQKNDETSTDYDHITGEIRGRSHVACSLNFKVPTFVPKKIGNICMRFLDTCNFMGENLDNLVKILPADGFKITGKEFQGRNVSLLKVNTEFCSKFLENGDIFLFENLLAPVTIFSGFLSELDISKAEYEHACKVWREYKIRNNKEFCHHHLKTRVTFLADVFENFRNVCSTTFNLDPCNYQTMQDVTFDSALKISQVELELLSDCDVFSMIEAGIRGDFGNVVTRYMKANNDDCEDFDPRKPTSHLAYFRANYIHATQMLEPLPIGDFKFENPEKYDSKCIMNIPDDGKFGYIFEVSLEYPHSLHDPHSEHTFCQTLQTPPLNKDNKVKVLMGTLYDKENYVLHFRALKQALQSGLVLKQVHRVLKFKQSKWLKPYIEKITQLLRDAPNEFSKRFFDWALNSIHGKFLEDVRDTKLFTVVQTDDQLQKKLNKFNFLDFHIYSENCVAVILDQPEVIFDQPVYVGMVLMDLVKMQMNHFFYDVMKRQFGQRVKNCYEDSDFFVLSIESEDIASELFKIRQHFDFSNYPVNHMLHSEANKDKLGTFKNMTALNPILGFVGIREKCFAMHQRDAADTSMEDSD
ncbi:hypothetical protein B566_EDAN016485 [Ephemera danica]|nr:hypothetical protein B566_EDAN016485 [Ephemera danica]